MARSLNARRRLIWNAKNQHELVNGVNHLFGRRQIIALIMRVTFTTIASMKIRVLGFEPLPLHLPDGAVAGPTSGFTWMEQNKGHAFNKSLTVAVTKVDSDRWLAGVVLKSRDAKSFTVMHKEGGVSKVKAEKLPDGENLTEANFFLAHPITGRGLYAHHYKSASLTGGFAWLCAKSFHHQLRKLRDDRLATPGLTSAQKSAIRKQHRGNFTLSQLLSNMNLKAFLRTLKRVNSFEASFTSFDLEEDIFDPISKLARRKTVRFQFPPDVSLDSLESELETVADSSDLDDFWIEGIGAHNRAVEFRQNLNAMVFSECDYDEMLGDLSISFADWQRSIENSAVTRHLIGIANGQQVSRLLSKA